MDRAHFEEHFGKLDDRAWARCEADPAFRRRLLGLRRRAWERRAAAPPRSALDLSCVHRGDVLREVACRPCRDGLTLAPIDSCALHVECSRKAGILAHGTTGLPVRACLTCGDRRHPNADTAATDWAVAITAAPRKDPTLLRSTLSAIAAGFAPTVYAEPHTHQAADVAALGVPLVLRPQRLGCYGNWIETLRNLLSANPAATKLAILQDDAVYCRGVREFLDRDLWPSSNTGCVSLYTPDTRGFEAPDSHPPNCKRVRTAYLIGAVAYVFPRYAAERIVSHPLARTWRGRANGKAAKGVERAAVDAFVGHVLSRLGLSVHHYDPGLVQHVAETSSIGNGGRNQTRGGRRYRKSIRWDREVGEQAIAADVHPPDSRWVRYDLPSGEQRYPGPEPTVEQLRNEPVTVVIPGVDLIEKTKRCLDSLAGSIVSTGQRVPVRIVYVDNGSAPTVADEIEDHALYMLALDFESIRNPTNLGFTAATNQGIARAGDSHVLLLNNDAHLGPTALANMLRHLLWHPRTAAVGPLSDDHGIQSIKKPALAKLRREQGHRPYAIDRDMLTGFCCLKHRDALREIGPLDESYPGGKGSDDDWCARARKAGWRLLLSIDALCHHDHHSTFRALGVPHQQLGREAAAMLRRRGRR